MDVRVEVHSCGTNLYCIVCIIVALEAWILDYSIMLLKFESSACVLGKAQVT